MIALLRRLHHWIGIAIAIPIFFVAISGALLIFRDPYLRTRYPVLRAPITAQQEAVYPDVLTTIEARFTPPQGVRVVKFPRNGTNAFHVYLSDRSEALIDPRTGGLIARWTWSTSAPAFLFDLHAHLLAGATGEAINGYLALLVVFLGLSGFLLWVPRRRSAFRLRHAVPRGTTRPALFRAHAASGVLLLAPVLLFTATGAALVFYEQVSRGMSAMLDRTPPLAPRAVVVPSGTPRRPWRDVLAVARHTLPEAGPAMFSPGSAANAVLTFRKSLPGEWHPNGRSYVFVDPYTAHVVLAIDARTQGWGTRAMHAVYPIHAAKVGGATVAVAALVAALGLGWLAVGSTWSFSGKVLADLVVTPSATRSGSASGRRANADDDQGSRSRSGDLRSALHTHEPGNVPTALHADHRRS